MTQLGTKKSRKGCVQCKRRRVKCNEESPCTNCTRRGEDCSLAQPSPGSTRELRDPALPSSTEEWMQEMELMHHYSDYLIHQPLGIREGAGQLWKKVVPEEGLKHPFLLHGILAFSALNLAYLRPTDAQKYLALCDRHQSVALTAYRNILAGEITREISTALFAIASVISISAMARSCAVGAIMPEPKHLTLDEMAELFYLTRGVRDVISVAHEFIINGPMNAMFRGHEMPPDMEPLIILPPCVRFQFDRLDKVLLADDPSHRQDIAICRTALRDLDEIYRNIRYFGRRSELETGQIWRWTTMVPTEFVRLIQARFPPTLVLMAYFASATSIPNNAWYTTNWGKFAIQGISMALGRNMQHWLDWPSEQMATGHAAVMQDEGEVER